jgi:hypothetical protein
MKDFLHQLTLQAVVVETNCEEKRTIAEIELQHNKASSTSVNIKTQQ